MFGSERSEQLQREQKLVPVSLVVRMPSPLENLLATHGFDKARWVLKSLLLCITVSAVNCLCLAIE